MWTIPVGERLVYKVTQEARRLYLVALPSPRAPNPLRLVVELEEGTKTVLLVFKSSTLVMSPHFCPHFTGRSKSRGRQWM